MEKSVLIRRDRVMNMLGGVSLSTLYRLMEKEVIPKPIKLSKQVAVWVESEIQIAIEEMIQEKRSAQTVQTK